MEELRGCIIEYKMVCALLIILLASMTIFVGIYGHCRPRSWPASRNGCVFSFVTACLCFLACLLYWLALPEYRVNFWMMIVMGVVAITDFLAIWSTPSGRIPPSLFEKL